MTKNFVCRRNVLNATAIVAAGTLLVGAVAGCDADPAATAQPAAGLHMISNGGHRLAFHLTPGHLPAIVLDAGGGADSSYWKDIVPKLSAQTGSEIITYDRAGVGASDEAPGPWHVEDAVSDLTAGLTELGVTHDVILVSHSLSGEIATSFVNKNPRWVAGSVLVDASLPDFYTDSELTRIEAANSEQIEELKKQPSTKQTRQLIAVAENYGPWHRAYHQMSWPASTPATVIESAKTPFDTPEDAQLWRDAQAHFAEAAPNRYLVIAENSSHDVPIDRPDVVTDAIDGMAERLG